MNSSKKKTAFTVIEVLGVICLILILVGIFVPKFINNSEKAKTISGWKMIFENAQYEVKLFQIQNKEKITAICENKSCDKTKEIVKILKPYLGVETGSESVVVSDYKYSFLNSKRVKKKSRYHTEDFILVNKDLLIGLKWETCECDDKIPCGYLLFDVNGTNPPNKFGKDIFGADIFKNELKAFGSGQDEFSLKKNCSKFRRGIYCSEYYLIGGKFY